MGRRVSLHLYLTDAEHALLSTISAVERESGISRYVTKLVKRDLCESEQFQGHLPPPEKTPEEYEAKIQHLHEVIQGRNEEIKKLKKELKEVCNVK